MESWVGAGRGVNMKASCSAEETRVEASWSGKMGQQLCKPGFESPLSRLLLE